MQRATHKNVAFWDRTAEKYAASRISDEAGYERTLLAVRDRLEPGHRVLEIGCGTGTTALRLSDCAGELVATDPSPKMIEIARSKGESQNCSNVCFSVGDPVSQPVTPMGFDVVLAMNVLHLVPSMPATLEAVYMHLKPGGIFISKTPCISLISVWIRYLAAIAKLVGQAPEFTVFSPPELEKQIRQAGLDVVEVSWHAGKGKDVRPYIVAQRPL